MKKGAVNNLGQSRYSRVSSSIVGAVALLIFVWLIGWPPQRRVGEWTDPAGERVPRSLAHRLDRVEFGYLPAFGSAARVGRRELIGYTSALALEDGIVYRYQAFYWYVDWLCVAVIITVSGVALSAARAYATTMRRWIMVGVILVLGATLIATVRSQVETIADRERIAMRCDELSERLKTNANDKEALNELVKIMKGNWSFARVHAAGALGDAGPNAMPAIHDLIRAMGSEDRFVWREAVIAVGKVSKGSSVGVDPLIKMLDHPSLSPYFIAEALAEIGAPAEKAIEPLRRVAEGSTDSSVVRAANKAIDEIQAAVKKAEKKQ